MILTNRKSVNAGPSNGTGEGVAHSKRWYVALVRMHHEKKVAERLDKMGIENFVPVQQEIHQWSDRRKKVEAVLLPMMVFVHADPKERMEVLSFSTVSRYMVMRGESTPAVIPDEQMARFRFMLDYSEEAVCMNSSPLARGEKVRVIKGPLTGLVGELVNVDGKTKIAVRLNLLGCACVDMPIGYVETASEKNKYSYHLSAIYMKKNLSGAFALILFSFFFSACQSYKQVPYLQDAEVLKQANAQIAPVQDARLIPGDEVSILVSTSDPAVSQPFNAQGNVFLLDNQGNINYPVLGKLSLNGLTSREAENLITERLKAYVKERPTVVVRMSGFKVSVLGEVASPGVYPVVNEQINVLEALAMAGDLTIYGVRDNVKLIREDKNGHKQFITLNLNDADLLLSPYYQLQQNDILYVTPNKAKAQNADIGPSTTLWITGFSVLLSIASLLVNILR